MSLFEFLKRKIQSIISNRQTDRMRYLGGDGSTIENAIIINAQSTLDGVAAEYKYISNKHGERNRNWSLKYQFLTKKDDKHFDAMVVKLTNGQELTYYFDISMFIGKF